MQSNRQMNFFALWCLVSCGGALRSHRQESALGQTAEEGTRAEWLECARVESEDTAYWSEEWGVLESALLQLRAFAEVASGNASANASANASSAANHTPVTHTENKTATPKKLDAASEVARAMAHVKLNPKSTADLVPALAMLKGMYEDGKERIGALNVREQKSKQQYEEKETRHTARIATIDTRFHNHSLNEEFHTNETRDENRLWNYWKGVRERQHRQFHTSLKIQHGMMDKVKKMIDMYEQTISGKVDKGTIKKELARVSGNALPDVVFLQQRVREVRQAVRDFCQESISQIHASRLQH